MLNSTITETEAYAPKKDYIVDEERIKSRKYEPSNKYPLQYL